MVLGPNLILEGNRVNSYPPADCLPVQADSTEFGRFGALVTIRRYDPQGDDPGINEGENEVSRCYFSHAFIKRVSCTDGIALWPPEITSSHLLPMCPVLVYPPVAHLGFTLSKNECLASFRKAIVLELAGMVQEQGKSESEL